MAGAKGGESVEVEIPFPSLLHRTEISGLVVELFKSILYQRNQIPLPYNKLVQDIGRIGGVPGVDLKDITNNPRQISKLQKEESRKRRQRDKYSKKAATFIGCCDEFLDCLKKKIDEEGDDIVSIRFLLGATPVSARCEYRVRFPATLAADRPTCTGFRPGPLLFRSLVTNQEILRLTSAKLPVKNIFTFIEKRSSTLSDRLFIPVAEPSSRTRGAVIRILLLSPPLPQPSMDVNPPIATEQNPLNILAPSLKRPRTSSECSPGGPTAPRLRFHSGSPGGSLYSWDRCTPVPMEICTPAIGKETFALPGCIRSRHTSGPVQCVRQAGVQTPLTRAQYCGTVQQEGPIQTPLTRAQYNGRTPRTTSSRDTLNLCTPAHRTSSMEFCTPAYRASYMELCTPAHRTSSLEMCTPANMTSHMEPSTPAYGIMETCTPAYRTGSKGSYMELCTPAYRRTSMELCTPACSVSRVNSCTPGKSLPYTAAISCNAPELCTGYLETDLCTLTIQDVHTPVLRKSVRFKPCDTPAECCQDDINASNCPENASSPLDNASSPPDNTSNILDLSSSPCLRLASFFIGSDDNLMKEAAGNVSSSNIQEDSVNAELSEYRDPEKPKLETDANKLENIKSCAIMDELDPNVLEPTVLEYHELIDDVFRPEGLNLEPAYPPTYWCTWSKPIKGFSEAFIM